MARWKQAILAGTLWVASVGVFQHFWSQPPLPAEIVGPGLAVLGAPNGQPGVIYDPGRGRLLIVSTLPAETSICILGRCHTAQDWIVGQPMGGPGVQVLQGRYRPVATYDPHDGRLDLLDALPVDTLVCVMDRCLLDREWRQLAGAHP